VFALAVVLYELSTGRHPFGSRGSRARLLGRASTSGAIQRRSIELPGADELLAAIDAARAVPPSRHEPTLSPFLDRLLLAALARAPLERPSAPELVLRLVEGERSDWWRARLQPTAREDPEPEDGAETWPLVGREAELAALSDVYAGLGATHPPRAAVVWLVGPEGSGKWRLLTSFAERMRKRDSRRSCSTRAGARPTRAARPARCSCCSTAGSASPAGARRSRARWRA
jgi:hypothetical protein